MQREAVKTYKIDESRTLNIYYDEDRESPREWDNLGVMACSHPHYDLSDKGQELKPDNFDSKEELIKYLKEERGAICLMPLYLYDHSGISISTSDSYPYNDRWDAGQVGFIYTTKERLKVMGLNEKPNAKELDDIHKQLIGEVETYNQYLTGDVYGFVLEKTDKCPTCGDEEPEHLDSCWGFYGDDIMENGILEHLPADVVEAVKVQTKKKGATV